MPVYVHRSTRDLVTVTGADSASYLQGQLSQDVAALAVGDTTWSFVLAPQGKVDGWGRVQRLAEESFIIDVEPGAGALWSSRLQRFLMRTKAEIGVETDVPMVSVRGDVGEQPEHAIIAGWPGIAGYDLLTDEAAHHMTDVADAVELDETGFDALRIRSGVPRWGFELEENTIPATVGQWVIDASVSFTKGCYTGQELVARIESRGGNVPRRLVGLEIDGDAPDRGAEVVIDGAAVGVVTSSAPEADGSVALAFLNRAVELGEAGTIDGAVGSTPARLVAVPFTGPR